MLTTIMKWVSIAVLLGAAFRLPSPGYEVLLEFVVCVSGLLVIMQAVRAGRYAWAAAFTVIVVLFNPIVPIAVTLSPRTFFLLDWASILTFLVALVGLKRHARLSIPSITNRMPRSQSL
jgi:hypothetical protein